MANCFVHGSIAMVIFLFLCFGDSEMLNGNNKRTHNCTLLIKIPNWLARKHNTYVEYAKNDLHLGDMLASLYDSEYNETNDLSSTNNQPYWAEQFNNDPKSSNSYFKNLYKRRAQAMFHKNPHAQTYDLDNESTFISEMDKQFITRKYLHRYWYLSAYVCVCHGFYEFYCY